MRTLTALCLCMVLAATGAHADITTLFPTMDGWEPEGEPMVYGADNLFEYLDGAADLYLTYDFMEMGSLSYYDSQGRGLTIDIFEHGSDADAFGIYSQERPSSMKAVDIGAQGYYEFGILNFCQGHYYVKIAGFDLNEFDEEMLTIVGKIISSKIGGDKELPKALTCFPADAMLKNSSRYIAKNVFGHGFLHSAFVAEYRSDHGANERGFIIQADDGAEADEMLENYLDYAKKNGATVADDNGIYRFEDPATKSSGAVNLKKSGSYIWGISTDSESDGNAFISGVETNLKSAGLLQ
jgi:hypothetical protein